MPKTRLTRASWTTAGLTALVKLGPTALAAEPLARQLGTTKGSFYWHFKDVPDFQSAVVKAWQAKAFASVVSALADEGTPEERLRRFGRLILSDRLDPAFRAWAHTDASVSRALAQVDAERLTYTANLLRQLGVTNPHFAQSCLGSLIGLPLLKSGAASLDAFDTMIDLVLALK